jgi:hypothetical protein
MSRRIAFLLSCLALAGNAAAEDAAAGQSVWIGGSVDISQAVDGPVHAAGGTVIVNAPVNGNVHAAGGTVELGSAAVIAGDAALAGGWINVDGSIKGKLRAAGGQVRINGPVAGGASIAEGKLVFRGEDLRRDPAAQVTGGVEQRQGHARMHAHTQASRFARGWIWTGGLMVLAALIAVALPGPSQRMAQELRERPWITPFLGLVTVFSIPIAAVLIMITVIGIPIGLLALIGHAALLLVGYVWIAVVLGGMLLDRVKPETAAITAWRVGAAVLAMLALAVLVRLPVVGHLVGLAALAMGVGMIVAAVLRHSHGPEARPA